jgi:hypothetical protein
VTGTAAKRSGEPSLLDPFDGGRRDVWQAILVLVRRFYLTAPIIAVVVGAAYLMVQTTPREYTATTSLVLLRPSAAPPVAGAPAQASSNPYVLLGPNGFAGMLQDDAGDANVRSRLLAAGDSVNYTVAASKSTMYSVATSGPTPILMITATDSNSRRALATVAELAAIMRADVVTRQKPYGTDVSQQITAQPLGNPTIARDKTPALRKAEWIAVSAAVVLAILLILAVDTWLQRRHRNDGAPGNGRHSSTVAA